MLLAELFRAESTLQVYATLHEFLRNHEHVFEKLGKPTIQSVCPTIAYKTSYAMMMAVTCGSLLSTRQEIM